MIPQNHDSGPISEFKKTEYDKWEQIVNGKTGSKLAEFPGHPCVLISYDLWIDVDQRGRGIGQKMHEERLAWLKEQGIESVLALVYRKNEVQNHILTKFGWEKVFNTGNEMILWARRI